MKNILLLVYLNVYTSILCAQLISFDNSVVLFDHPRMSDTGLNYPVIPLNYNDDEFTDFIGATFNDQFIFKGSGISDYEYIDIYQGFASNPLKVMDYNNDGKQDIIMDNYVNIYESGDDFQFLTLGFDFQETIIEVADFNSDGFNDVITQKDVTFENDQLIMNINQGDDTFVSTTLVNQYDLGDLEIGDIDNDGDIDIAFINTIGDVPVVILYNQDASFELREVPHRYNVGRTTIKLVDVDLDGDLDIITTGTFDNIYTLENVDNFMEDNYVYRTIVDDVLYFNVADLDKDNVNDIVCIVKNSSSIKVKVLKGLNGFLYQNVYESASFMSSTFFGYPNMNYVKNNLPLYDVDNDGLIDIIYNDGFGEPNQIHWFKNSTDVVSSIKNKVLDNEYIISPNPAHQSIIITGKYVGQEFNYQISNLNGTLIDYGVSNDNEITLSNLLPGVYIIKSKELGMIQRFIKI